MGFSGAVDLVGDRRWAEALYDLAAPYAGRNCTLGVASFLGAADHWLGVLAARGRPLHRGHRAPGGRAGTARDMGARPLTALTQEAYGRVLSLRGQSADIERAPRSGRPRMRTAEELGLAAISDRPASGADAGPHAAHAGRATEVEELAISGTRRPRPWLPTIASRWA